MALSVSSKAAVKADINVTPMIDVMLVLLIIFMIVTPAITKGFQAVVPRAEHAEKKPEEPGEIRLGIDKDGKYYLDLGQGPRQVADADLAGRLQALYEGRDDKILYLKADQNLNYGRVEQAIEIARQAGVRMVAAISEQKRTLGKEQ